MQNQNPNPGVHIWTQIPCPFHHTRIPNKMCLYLYEKWWQREIFDSYHHMNGPVVLLTTVLFNEILWLKQIFNTLFSCLQQRIVTDTWLKIASLFKYVPLSSFNTLHAEDVPNCAITNKFSEMSGSMTCYLCDIYFQDKKENKTQKKSRTWLIILFNFTRVLEYKGNWNTKCS